jgi:hypothetical protein
MTTKTGRIADKVLHIDFPPKHDVQTGGPPDLQADSFRNAGRERIPPPLERFEYLPDLLAEQVRCPPLHLVSLSSADLGWDGLS